MARRLGQGPAQGLATSRTGTSGRGQRTGTSGRGQRKARPLAADQTPGTTASSRGPIAGDDGQQQGTTSTPVRLEVAAAGLEPIDDGDRDGADGRLRPRTGECGQEQRRLCWQEERRRDPSYGLWETLA